MTDAAPRGSLSEALAGVVERVTFHNEETGFCVLPVRDSPEMRAVGAAVVVGARLLAQTGKSGGIEALAVGALAALHRLGSIASSCICRLSKLITTETRLGYPVLPRETKPPTSRSRGAILPALSAGSTTVDTGGWDEQTRPQPVNCRWRHEVAIAGSHTVTITLAVLLLLIEPADPDVHRHPHVEEAVQHLTAW